MFTAIFNFILDNMWNIVMVLLVLFAGLFLWDAFFKGLEELEDDERDETFYRRYGIDKNTWKN